MNAITQKEADKFFDIAQRQIAINKQLSAELAALRAENAKLREALESQSKAVEVMFRDWNMARVTKVTVDGGDEDSYRNGLDMMKAFDNLDVANRTARRALEAK